MFQGSALVEMIMKLGVLFKALKKSVHEAEPLLGIFDHILTLSFYYPYICFVPRYFDDSYLTLFVAGKADLRTNLFQLGEDDTFLRSTKELEHGSWMGHEAMDKQRAQGAFGALIGVNNCSITKRFIKIYECPYHQRIFKRITWTLGCIHATSVVIHVQDG